MDPLPGWFERRRQNLPGTEVIVSGLPTGPSLDDVGQKAARSDRSEPAPPGARQPDGSSRDDARDFPPNRQGYGRPRRGGGTSR
jgi:hypothetical protein